jgi:hypothetical protein
MQTVTRGGRFPIIQTDVPMAMVRAVKAILANE